MQVLLRSGERRDENDAALRSLGSLPPARSQPAAIDGFNGDLLFGYFQTRSASCFSRPLEPSLPYRFRPANSLWPVSRLVRLASGGRLSSIRRGLFPPPLAAGRHRVAGNVAAGCPRP